jgi:hypothetical protein
LRSGAIDPEGVERLHDDGIAWLHAERGRVLPHGVEESLGIETVGGHAVSSGMAKRAGLALSHPWLEGRVVRMHYANIKIL